MTLQGECGLFSGAPSSFTDPDTERRHSGTTEEFPGTKGWPGPRLLVGMGWERPLLQLFTPLQWQTPWLALLQVGGGGEGEGSSPRKVRFMQLLRVRGLISQGSPFLKSSVSYYGYRMGTCKAWVRTPEIPPLQALPEMQPPLSSPWTNLGTYKVRKTKRLDCKSTDKTFLFATHKTSKIQNT